MSRTKTVQFATRHRGTCPSFAWNGTSNRRRLVVRPSQPVTTDWRRTYGSLLVPYGLSLKQRRRTFPSATTTRQEDRASRTLSLFHRNFRRRRLSSGSKHTYRVGARRTADSVAVTFPTSSLLRITSAGDTCQFSSASVGTRRQSINYGRVSATSYKISM